MTSGTTRNCIPGVDECLEGKAVYMLGLFVFHEDILFVHWVNHGRRLIFDIEHCCGRGLGVCCKSYMACLGSG